MKKKDSHEVHHLLLDVMKRAQGTDLASYEERSANLDELRSLITEMLHTSRSALSEIATYYEQQEPEGARLDARLCHEVEKRSADLQTPRQIADLAFIARLGLGGRLDALNALGPDSDRWELIGLANSTMREVLKSFSALEIALCGYEGLKVENSYYLTEVERSVQTREAYRAFRRVIPMDEPASDDETLKRLRISAIAIAKLIGRDIYPSLRVRDRKQIRGLQERIIDWLRSDLKPITGRRIWQDLTSFADLLQQVNNRAELKQHDRELVEKGLRRADEMLAQGRELAEDISCVSPDLKRLLGRDPEIDEMIEDEGAVHLPRLRMKLERLARLLEPEGAAPSKPEPTTRPDADDGDFF